MLFFGWSSDHKGIRTFGYEHRIINTKIKRLAGLPSIILYSFLLLFSLLLLWIKPCMFWIEQNWIYISGLSFCVKNPCCFVPIFSMKNDIHKRWFIIFSFLFKLITSHHLSIDQQHVPSNQVLIYKITKQAIEVQIWGMFVLVLPTISKYNYVLILNIWNSFNTHFLKYWCIFTSCPLLNTHSISKGLI